MESFWTASKDKVLPWEGVYPSDYGRNRWKYLSQKANLWGTLFVSQQKTLPNN